MATRRSLHTWEMRAACTVFADSIDYRRVRVHEDSGWVNTADDWLRWFRDMPSRPAEHHNAIALGFHCFFPVRLPHPVDKPANMPVASMAWLLHELTHVWQFENMGWSYLLSTAVAHVRERSQVYDFGGEDGLRSSRRQGRRLQSFNLEQQAAIVQSAYYNECTGNSDPIWWEYLADMS